MRVKGWYNWFGGSHNGASTPEPVQRNLIDHPRRKKQLYHRDLNERDYWERVTEKASVQAWYRMKNEETSGATTYWSHITDAASIQAYRHDERASSTISAEALPENSSLIDFKSFAREYPDKLFPLLAKLRTEFQELFIEYYMLEKSQSFLAKAHGQIQTRIWQNLRIIEQALGALIVLGTEPKHGTLRPILEKAGWDNTMYGSLTELIVLYAKTQNYAVVAKSVAAPVPAIRKIFRPAIDTLVASKNIKEVAVGYYLRNLTHQASLTGGGLSKRCIARTRRVKTLRFDAPPSDTSPVISFGPIAMLRDTPWSMFEISSENRMTQIFPVLREQGKRLFGKKAAQIFAPTDADGELEFGYILARSYSPTLTRGLCRVRGISEMAARYTDEGNFISAVTITDAEVQKLIGARTSQVVADVKVGDFVQILTGGAANYCGSITRINNTSMTVEVNFPSGRRFIVTADATSVKAIPAPRSGRQFWGAKP